MWKNTGYRYGILSIGLHWLMLLLLATVYSCIELKGIFPKGSDAHQAMKDWHFMLGLSVFALVWIRLALRLAGSVPRIEPEPAAWRSLSAKLIHIALYGFMISMPLLGWLMLSAGGKPIPFFGMELPALIEQKKTWAKFVKNIHETIGTVGYYLIGLHADAAIFHHYILRINTI